MSRCYNWFIGAILLCTLIIVLLLNYSTQNKREELKLVFDEYILKHKKSYKNDPIEYEKRFEHFLESMDEIEKLNAESHGPNALRAHYGLTKLSDMSKTEFKDIHLSDELVNKHPHLYGRSWSGYLDGSEMRRFKYAFVKNTIHVDENKTTKGKSQDKIYMRKKRLALPLEIDWRKKGVISPVRNQGLCGACWAFSTVGTMESMAAISTGKLQQLSVQEIVDCAASGNNGCLGGDICLLLNWLLHTGTPVELDSSYPLRLINGECRINKNYTVGVKVKSFTCNDMVGDEQKLLLALATHGPVAVAVNAFTWQNYLGGVIQYHCSGQATDLNHAVQLVGYNLNADVPYYIAKNSWGPEFGEDGYLKLVIGNNICGLANEVATIDVSV